MTIYRKKSEAKEVMTLQETATYLNCSFQTLKKVIKNGEIVCRKVGQRYFIAKEVVDAWLKGESIANK